MTRKDEFIEQLEGYLDEYEGVTPLPDAVRDGIRAELPKTKQAHPLSGWARFTTMNNPMRYGIAAAAVVVVALVGWSMMNNTVIGPGAGSPSPTTATTPDASMAAVDMPSDLQHTFLGPVDGNADPGTIKTTQLVFTATGLSLNPNGLELYRSVRVSEGTRAVPGEFTIVATSNDQGCRAGDQGTFRWEFSRSASNPTILSLRWERDDCEARAVALAGNWILPACRVEAALCPGNLGDAGGWGSSYFGARWSGSWDPRIATLTFEHPGGWAAYTDGPDEYSLTPESQYANYDISGCYDCDGSHDTVSVLSNPGAMAEDCSDALVPGVGQRAADLVAWLEQHRGLDVSDAADVTIDGRAATALTITPRSDWMGTCPESGQADWVPVFYNADSYGFTLPTDDAWRVILLDVDANNTVAIVVDAGAGGDLDAFVRETAPIVESLAFNPPD